MTTRATDTRPTRRVLTGWQGQEYVVELRGTLILVRPKGARRGGKSEFAITPSALHDYMVLRAAAERERERRRLAAARRRGRGR